MFFIQYTVSVDQSIFIQKSTSNTHFVPTVNFHNTSFNWGDLLSNNSQIIRAKQIINLLVKIKPEK